MPLTSIHVGVRPDLDDENSPRDADGLMNEAREHIARRYGQVGDYDLLQEGDQENGRTPWIAANIEMPEFLWDLLQSNGTLTIEGRGVIIEAEMP
jgi:hypothetical protein